MVIELITLALMTLMPYGEFILSTIRASPSLPFQLEISVRFSSLCTHHVYIHKCILILLMFLP